MCGYQIMVLNVFGFMPKQQRIPQILVNPLHQCYFAGGLKTGKYDCAGIKIIPALENNT